MSTTHIDYDFTNEDANKPLATQYFSAYMSPASPAADSSAAGTGATWFKIWEDAPVYENGALVFPSQSAFLVPIFSPGCR